jgi:hypothetical protein
MSKSVSGTRTIHTNSIRDEILTYLKPSEDISLAFEIPGKLPRDRRGMNNHTTARFLTPRRHLDEYEAAPQRYTTRTHSFPLLTYTLIALVARLTSSQVVDSPVICWWQRNGRHFSMTKHLGGALAT